MSKEAILAAITTLILVAVMSLFAIRFEWNSSIGDLLSPIILYFVLKHSIKTEGELQ